VSFDFFESTLKTQHVDRPFDLGGPVLQVDTTTDADVAEVIAWVRSEMAQVPRSS
jgi:hypothetical protein